MPSRRAVARDAAGDLAAVGDQDLLEHGVSAARVRSGLRLRSVAARRAAPRQSPRRNLASSQIGATITPASAPARRRAAGCAHDSQSAPGTRPSPSSDRAMLENGSGEVLTAARVVAFATWLVAASVPPSSAATVAQVRVVGAEHRRRERRAGRDAHDGVERVPDACRAPGILSTKNSTNEHQPLAPSSSGCCSTCRPLRQLRPSRARRRGR